MTEITFQTKDERRFNSNFRGGSRSYYDCEDDIIRLIYYGDSKLLINELDHEIIHVILHHFVNIETSEKFDNTLLQLGCAVGFKNPNQFLNSLIIDKFRNLDQLKKDLKKVRLVVRY